MERDENKAENMDVDQLCQPAWYVLRTRARHEKSVRDQLGAKGIHHFLPLWYKRSVWKDRVKTVELPLFSGYLFVSLALQDRLPVLQTLGVAGFLTLQGRPIPVSDGEVEALQGMMARRLCYEPHPFLREGTRVRVKNGFLAGAEGVLVGRRQRYRLVVNVDLIHQAVAVDIESSDVEVID